MILIPDDPIIANMMRTGYPPWIRDDPQYWEDTEEFGEDDEVFYGNETTEF